MSNGPQLVTDFADSFLIGNQMTIDGVKRTAQEQVNRALKDHAR